ncbi:MAG: rhodanese-like domain-containing protein [Romboutsia timonensis]|uniref:rhodanese-like domain-containing protein n=1 Tax=Romboutsia timonensis TaxID=1776391 RepID=UPI003992073F
MKVINNFKVLGIVSILILSLGFIAGCSSKNKVSNTIQQSEETKGYENIDGKQTEKLLNSDKDVLIIDVRSEYEYEKGHLLNAINLPYDDDDFKSELNEIIDYKDKTVLVYCRSGNRSEKAAVKLVDNGFKNVKNVTDGVDEYDYKLVKVDNITGREAEKMINDDKHDKDLIILDVREPKDFNNGHLLNAINIPIENIDKRMDELRNYKSKDIIVYCNTGRKSAEVAEKLVEHGFTDVTNIVDGVSEYDFKLVK